MLDWVPSFMSLSDTCIAQHTGIETELCTAGTACAARSAYLYADWSLPPYRYVAMGEADLLNPLVVANARGQGVVAGNVVGRGTNLTLAYTPITLTSRGAPALPSRPHEPGSLPQSRGYVAAYSELDLRSAERSLLSQK